MSDQIDPELAKLLEDIEAVENEASTLASDDTTAEVVSDEDTPSEKTRPEPKSAIDELLEDSGIEDFNSIDDDADDAADEEEVFLEPEIVPIDREKEQLEKDVIGLLRKHCDNVDIMMEESVQDRKRADDILSKLVTKLDSDSYRGADVVAITSLMQTKADISRNRASIMDSIAKLYASLKNNDSVGLRSGGNDDKVTPDDVQKMLNTRAID